jgi:hypothetical protein
VSELPGAVATPARRLRAARLAAVGIALCASTALLLSGCSNGGSALARAACVHVYDSIHLYTQAQHARSVAAARAKADKATNELNEALQLAAQANTADPAFNPLMTTLQETGRTPESNLIPALRAQCEAAQNPTSQSPVPGGPTPGTAPS